MQTLGLSDSMPRTEGRLKSLFWPSIQSSSDVDYLGAQGYWVCAAVAVLSCILLLFLDRPILAIVVLIFYYLSGVGVRERSRYAAACVFVAYFGDMLASPSIVKALLTALLLSNLRATWIAATWAADSDKAIAPPRWSDSWTDKFADTFPTWLWPKARILYYILSGGYLLLMMLGVAVLARRHL